MTEITHITLENEMDLILAHKQSMRLAELTGLSTSAQTTFATAVSEVSRTVIGKDDRACLRLYVSDKDEKPKVIIARLEDKRSGFSPELDEGYIYAKRLVSNIAFQTDNGRNNTSLYYRLPQSSRIDDVLIEKWRINLNNDPAISPYEEIKRKNRQLAELAEKLQQSERQYKTLTDSLPIMILSLDATGRIIYANRWVTEYTGQSVEQLNNSRWAGILHPDDFSEVWNSWNEQVPKGEMVVRPERRYRNGQTGEYRWHIGISTPVHHENGSIAGWNTFMVDIHAQKIIEQTLKDNVALKATQTELEEKIRQLNHSNQQLEQFAYVASHDLQEPLRKITLYSDYLNKKHAASLPAEASVYFRHLIDASHRMKALIQDILAYSTLSELAFEQVNLNDVATDTLRDLEVSISEKSADISIDSLPVIQGNARQLRQLFENLLSNSLKYSVPQTRPKISVNAVLSDDKIMLRFSDNGIGFEEKYIDKMFNIFQRLHTRDKYSGTGIGLAICKKIVEMHNGEIMAESTLGNGATFTVTLPLAQN